MNRPLRFYIDRVAPSASVGQVVELEARRTWKLRTKAHLCGFWDLPLGLDSLPLRILTQD